MTTPPPDPAAAARQRNRQQMPETARIVDDLRAAFGDIPYGRFTENGRTIAWDKRPNP